MIMSNTEMLVESCGYVLNRDDNGEFTISSPDGIVPNILVEDVDGAKTAVIEIESMKFTDNELASDFTQAFNRAVNSMYVFNTVLKGEQNR